MGGLARFGLAARLINGDFGLSQVKSTTEYSPLQLRPVFSFKNPEVDLYRVGSIPGP